MPVHDGIVGGGRDGPVTSATIVQAFVQQRKSPATRTARAARISHTPCIFIDHTIFGTTIISDDYYYYYYYYYYHRENEIFIYSFVISTIVFITRRKKLFGGEKKKPERAKNLRFPLSDVCDCCVRSSTYARPTLITILTTGEKIIPFKKKKKT
jgi:hypothetical protein